MVKSTTVAESARRRRHRTPESEAAYALYEYERRRFGRRGRGIISVDFAKRQLQRFGYCSVVSGERKKLRLRRFWPDVELNDWNCVVVTKNENQSLAHTSDWLAHFPPFIVSLMKVQRELDEFDKKGNVDSQ